MKKIFLSSVLAMLPVVAAHATPTVYGKIFLTLDKSSKTLNEYDSKRVQLNSIGSKIGFKGQEPLTANTELIYQLEYGVEADDNNVQFKPRNTYIGLEHKKYGSLKAGRLVTVDDDINYGDIARGGVMLGGFLGQDAQRVNNMFIYTSPEYNHTKLLASYALDEDDGKHSANKLDTFKRDGFSVSVQHEQDKFSAGIGYFQAGKKKRLRVSGSYQVKTDLTVGGLLQTAKYEGGAKSENALTVSVEHKTATPWTVYGQIDTVSNAEGVKGANTNHALAGGEYAFNERTSGHIYGAYANIKEAGTKSKSAFGIGGGIEYSF